MDKRKREVLKGYAWVLFVVTCLVLVNVCTSDVNKKDEIKKESNK